MYVTLSDGNTYKLDFNHHAEYSNRRSTLLTMSDESEKTVAHGIAVVKPGDNFSRRLGRKYAATSLLRSLKTFNFSKSDRKRVFQAACPEYGEAVPVLTYARQNGASRILDRFIQLMKRV